MPSYDKAASPDESDVTGHLPYLQLKTSSHLIIPQWSTSTIYGLVTTMLAAVLAGVGYEFLNEYSRHLHNRNVRKPNGSRCCGIEVFGCCEKIVLSILLMIRVVIGYFMMLCVMTMNIWLLVSVVVGAGVGYCIGKPVIANRFTDSVSSYEYPVVRIKSSNDDDSDFGGNVTTRSQSWRFKTTSRQSMESTGRRLMESVLPEQETTGVRKSGDFSRYTLRPNSKENAINVVLIRESRAGAPSISDIKDEDDVVFLRNKADDKPVTRTTYSQTLPASQSRFKSTSLVINESFRSEKTSPQGRVKSGRSSRSPKGSSGRFKPISKVIIDNQTSVDKV